MAHVLLFQQFKSCYLRVSSMLSFLFQAYDFINTLQGMHLVLLKGGFQWSFSIYQRLLKLKSMFIMLFLLPLDDKFWSLCLSDNYN